MVYGICCMSVHCMVKPLVMQTLLLPFRLCQIVDLAVRNGCSKVLMSVGDTDSAVTDCHSEHVLLWSNVDLAHITCLTVAKRPRMNCFDDLFVPIDMVQFSIQAFICTVHASLSIRQPFMDPASVCFHAPIASST